MAKLIVALAALWILVPAVALAGGGFDQEQQVAQKTIVIENHVPANDNNGVIIAAAVAGIFSLAGVLVLRNKKS
ncbi:hypothetical protein LCGC14_0487530 [marine sediment metagenome]|uniref:Uncharacterized protein n=1 Tax=marine sediment metagenome TaxID=412755 RepID=A0A0F9VGC8_9ZZZZ